MRKFAPVLFALVALGLAGCDSPQKTVDQLRGEIATFKTTPSDALEAQIEQHLAKLDQQIVTLEEDGEAAEAAGFRSRAENLRADYRAAKLVRSMKDAQSAIEGIGQAFKDAGKSIGDVFRENPTPTPPTP